MASVEENWHTSGDSDVAIYGERKGYEQTAALAMWWNHA